MDLRQCQVILQDDRAIRDRMVTAMDSASTQYPEKSAVGDAIVDSESEDLASDLQGLLNVFESVYLAKTGSSCLAQIAQLDTTISNTYPILVLIPVARDLLASRRHISRVSTDLDPIPQGNVPFETKSGVHGLELLKHISQDQHHSKLVVPIAYVKSENYLESDAVVKLLEAGARDIVISYSDRCLGKLAVVATNAWIEGKKTRPAFLALKKQRKISWVGMQEDKPYAHLRETMVSKLMHSICEPQSDVAIEPTISAPYSIPRERQTFVEQAIGNWEFPAHDLDYDELAEAAVLMLKHALTMPELERWRMSDDEIRRFMLDCRSAYNDFVLYHNFRHIVDVLQAVFSFLIAIGALPKYPYQDGDKNQCNSPIASLIKPFDAFVLLVTAIGHDVGHPGVNNAFLVSIKAPLAQLYNDNSVLEAFHCAAYSQILRRYWPSVYEDVQIRQLVIKSILATDMQLHFKYMADLGNLQEKLAHNKGIDGWNEKILDDYRNLTCGLLIKCADISNLARPFRIAAKWTDILQLEFARQGEMERTVGIETTLFGGPPDLGNITKLANSQIGFMNIFALPLFESVTDILPPIKFTVSQIKANLEVWKQRIEEEKAKGSPSTSHLPVQTSDGWQSPRSASPERTTFSFAENSHPEGIPASGSDPHIPQFPPLNTSQGTPDTILLQPLPIADKDAATARSASAPNALESIKTENEFTTPTSIALKKELFRSTQSQENPINKNNDSFRHSQSQDSTHVAVGSNGVHINGWSPIAQKATVIETEVVQPTTRTSAGNFSRPMSQRHSATTRSSAPSGAPTLSSTFNPASPTETQATSLDERGSESDLSTEFNRPTSGNSGGLHGGSTYSSGYSSYSRGINGYIPAPQPSLHYFKNANGHVVESSAGRRDIIDKSLKTKRSRSRFFPPWFSKKNKSVDGVTNEQSR